MLLSHRRLIFCSSRTTLISSTIHKTPLTSFKCTSQLFSPVRFYATINEAGRSAGDYKRMERAMEKKVGDVKKNADMVSTPDSDQNSDAEATIKKLHFSPSVVYHDEDYNLAHPIWHNEYIWRVEETHQPRKTLLDNLAYYTISMIRFNFDWMSGWSFGRPTVKKAVNRIVFLETVAGVPGSIAGIIRHLASLRRMRRDNGWIHTLFEEAENERMHLLTFLEYKKPTAPFRGLVWLLQGVFFNFFFAAYLVSPKFCHRLVGYLEEQAVHTYTKILQEIDDDTSELAIWRTTPAPPIAKKYWKMSDSASIRDVIAVIRADESHHRDVNHSFAGMRHTDSNPFRPGH
eukprot:TRINITY_DN5301_c0_g1_i1.p1 TRINITY_DN5301_c0_g1~~TRINITY_DN5301_c0_g1_i1.p1  ORF type:complete len:345 (-),score=84.42 TRINITY_DN5301_c0_g1_i1:106-1140(-)